MQDQRDPSDFERNLAQLINKHGKEKDSDTSDFILAQYLVMCLSAYNISVRKREDWHNPDLSIEDKTT